MCVCFVCGSGLDRKPQLLCLLEPHMSWGARSTAEPHFDVAVLEFSRGIPLTSRTHANLQMAEVYRRTRERPMLFA